VDPQPEPARDPDPRFRTVEQAEGIAGTLARGPLSPEKTAAVDELLGRS